MLKEIITILKENITVAKDGDIVKYISCTFSIKLPTKADVYVHSFKALLFIS